MSTTGKIGLILPEIIDPLDYELLRGVHQQAQKLGLDVICFTGIFNSQIELQQDEYIYALENIYSLVCKADLDGILFAAERFHNKPLIWKIYDYLYQTDIPCLALGDEPQSMPFLHARQRESMYLMTKHLIEKHGHRHIYCITGDSNSTHSKERLAGFQDAMQEAGLKVSEEDVFYGYFWKDVPSQIGKQIASGELKRPDAVVCASDVMAMALIDSLRENGIRVPEDIAVTGYDGGWAPFLHSITTISGRDCQFGADAVCRLYELMTGNSIGLSEQKQSISFDESCGCIHYSAVHSTDDSITERYVKNHIYHSFNKKQYMASGYIGSVSNVNSLEDWAESVKHVAHILTGWEWMDICLCEDWQIDFENPEQFRQHGFSDTMLLALSKRPGIDYPMHTFPVQQLLPALEEPHEPLLVCLTSLHFKGQIFGYIATSYQKTEDIHLDELYLSWCDAAANGLNSLQQKQYTDYIRQQMEMLSVHDPATGLRNRRGLAEKLPDFLQACRKSERKPMLLLLTCMDKMPSNYDIALLAKSLKRSAPEHAILARVQERMFAVCLSGDDAPESVIRQVESSMRQMLGGSIRPPQLITFSKRLKYGTLSEAKNDVDNAILTIQRKAESDHYVNYKERLHSLRREMQAMPQKDWNISDIAQEIGISRSHLQRLYKELFEISIMDDLIVARITKAEQLLAHTDMRIVEVALECGYRNETHFMRQFKEKKGITATQFRKQQKQ